jgi:hypothetical protein
MVFVVLAASPAAAHADALDALQTLVKMHLRPAPLVPTRAPRPLSDIGRTLGSGQSLRKGGYSLLLTNNRPPTYIRLARGDYALMSAALRDYRRRHYAARPTRVRGRAGFVLTRSLSPREWVLLWREDGWVYSISTGPRRTVSVAMLRSTAAALDHLATAYDGSYEAPGDTEDFSATLVTTQHTITGVLEFDTNNCTFNGLPAAGRGGDADVAMLSLSHNAFTLPLNSGWAGSMVGTVSPSAVRIRMSGTGTFDGEFCDTGELSVTAVHHDPP